MTVRQPLMAGHAPFRARRSMAMCGTGGRLVLFGGVGAAGSESILDVSDDCWTFDPQRLQWQSVEQSAPWPSPRRCVGVAPAAGGLWLWGGSGVVDTTAGRRYNFLNDWWQFDLSTGQWSLLRDSDDHQISPRAAEPYPSPRYTPVFQTLGARLFLFSGYTEDRLGKRKLNDTWLYEGSQWQPVHTDGEPGYSEGAASPGLRYGCVSASEGDTAYIFGGFSDAGDHNDLWAFDALARRWRLLMPDSDSPGAPLPRYCAASAFHERRFYLFGGRSRRDPRANYNDLWRFDVTNGQWECLSPNRGPHHYDESAAFPAYHAKSSHAVVDGYWYLWGGEGLSGHVSDFWRYSFNSGDWQLLQSARGDDPRFW